MELRGIPCIDLETEERLTAILATAPGDDNNYVNESYIPVCAALVLDADSMLF